MYVRSKDTIQKLAQLNDYTQSCKIHSGSLFLPSKMVILEHSDIFLTMPKNCMCFFFSNIFNLLVITGVRCFGKAKSMNLDLEHEFEPGGLTTFHIIYTTQSKFITKSYHSTS
jgi:hypothetical protein